MWYFKFQPFNAWWIGVHYSSAYYRYCINILPCITVVYTVTAMKIDAPLGGIDISKPLALGIITLKLLVWALIFYLLTKL